VYPFSRLDGQTNPQQEPGEGGDLTKFLPVLSGGSQSEKYHQEYKNPDERHGKEIR
jgi:hypothetical protein